MVMVFEGSDSDSDNERSRHDRFRSERVLVKSSPDSHNPRSNRLRSRSRSPFRDRYVSHKRHYSDRRDEERSSKRRSVDNHRSSKDKISHRHSPVSKKSSSEIDKDRSSREKSKHLDSKKSEYSRTAHEKDKSKSSCNCKKNRSDHDRHSKERDKSRKEHKKSSPVDDRKHRSERDKHSSESEKRIKADDKNKNDKESAKSEKHKKTTNTEQCKQSSSDSKKDHTDHKAKNVEDKVDSGNLEVLNEPKITPDDKTNMEIKDKEKTLIGPMLPPHLQNQQREERGNNEENEGEEEEQIKKAGGEEECYGPVLPPGHRGREEETTQTAQPTSDQHGHCDDLVAEEDTIGPQLPGSTSATQLVLDHRASLLKKQMENKESNEAGQTKKREEWMTELPKNKGVTGLGLEARKFRTREAPSGKDSDTSGWTDTPADKEKKSLLRQMGQDGAPDVQEEHRLAVVKERDQEMEKLARKSKKDKKRGDKSLLEMHQKALKKKKKKEKKEREGKKEERRPFDRDIDLQANRLDEAQKKAVFKKAQLLNSRFSFGESKYL